MISKNSNYKVSFFFAIASQLANVIQIPDLIVALFWKSIAEVRFGNSVLIDTGYSCKETPAQDALLHKKRGFF